MTELVTEDIEQDIKRLAQESMRHLEPICQECWESGEDDILGNMSGVQTRYNKKINDLTDTIIEQTEDADIAWHSEIRFELLDLFREERNRQFYRSSMEVENDLECFYCFEDKKRKRDSDELPIRLSNTDGSSNHLFGRDESEWQ